VWENTGGTRGAQIYQLKGIPLTPGPLMVVIKVAASQTANASACASAQSVQSSLVQYVIIHNIMDCSSALISSVD
jgi:hypothetical protein